MYFTSPEIVKAGSEVTATGENLSADLQMHLGDTIIIGQLKNPNELLFKIPDGFHSGKIEISISKPDKVEINRSELLITPKDVNFYSDLSPEQVCKGTSFTDSAGSKKNCGIVDDSIATPYSQRLNYRGRDEVYDASTQPLYK